MTTAKEFLEREAEGLGFSCAKAFDGDYDITVAPRGPSPERFQGASASDLIRFAANLQEAGFLLIFMKNDSIHVHAPHRKEHSWGDRGWDCAHLASVEECKMGETIEKYKGWNLEKLLAERARAIQMRDMCMGDLYRSVNQGIIDEIDTILRKKHQDL